MAAITGLILISANIFFFFLGNSCHLHKLKSSPCTVAVTFPIVRLLISLIAGASSWQVRVKGDDTIDRTFLVNMLVILR